MKVLITGISGFLGLNLLQEINTKKFDELEIFCVSRNIEQAKKLTNHSAIKLISYDIYSNIEKLYEQIGVPNILVHMAWSGLPNFQEDFHIVDNLPKEKLFLNSSVDLGVERLIVTGTCFEYGLKEGCLEENIVTEPVSKYGIAKDLLRKSIQEKMLKTEFKLQWLRLFYPFGYAQNPKSLIPSLQRAIDKKDEEFFITDSNIKRDFIPVNEVARYILYLIFEKNLSGIINCCTGEPRSILDFATDYCKNKNSKIKIVPGKFPALNYEPQRFWGSTEKMLSSSFEFKNKFF